VPFGSSLRHVQRGFGSRFRGLTWAYGSGCCTLARYRICSRCRPASAPIDGSMLAAYRASIGLGLAYAKGEYPTTLREGCMRKRMLWAIFAAALTIASMSGTVLARPATEGACPSCGPRP
jgi:hypothetical protein